LFLQLPAASQLRVPLQLSSSPAGACTQEPPPPVQALHVPQTFVVQQCRSTQFPVVQSVPSAHVWPGTLLQAPVESQVFVPEQPLLGSSAPITLTHAPLVPVQLSHVPQDAVPQQ
jgi:hypothetical protein